MKCSWTKTLALGAFVLTMTPFAVSAEMPRSEWHNLVGDCAQNPQTLKSTIAQLSAADQAAFVAEVNEAISKMPGSDEVKAAAFYNANKAAVQGAKGNVPAVLAEVFATVPPEYLTEINERFASEVFNRSADPTKTYSDEAFTALAKKTMDTIIQRCQSAENAGVRETFAILMFLRASGGSPANLSETLVAQLPDAATRESAANEWIKPALGDGQEQTYDPMLGVAQAGDEPDHAVVASLVDGPQIGVAMLSELSMATDSASSAGKMANGAYVSPTIAGLAPNSDMSGTGLNRVPRAYVQSKDGVGGNGEGTAAGQENPYYTHARGDSAGSGVEPQPYAGQRW